ncbi:MAG: DUF2752 domain-containing protein [Ruminococcus sp.]|nr:DUF2752 domain-containing protein [Ruminococcus sp.]
MNRKKFKNIIFILSPLILIPAAYLIVSFYRDRISIYIPPCLIRTFTGIYCPGCGATHCIYELSSGHILKAVKYNAVIFGLIVYAVLLWAEKILSAFGKNIKIIPANHAFYAVTAGIAVLYFIIRNFIPLLAPV